MMMSPRELSEEDLRATQRWVDDGGRVARLEAIAMPPGEALPGRHEAARADGIDCVSGRAGPAPP